LAWYRASDGHRVALQRPAEPIDQVTTPTMVLWGRTDPWVRRGTVERAARYMDGPYRLVELDAGHWLVQDAPGNVGEAVLGHLSSWPL